MLLLGDKAFKEVVTLKGSHLNRSYLIWPASLLYFKKKKKGNVHMSEEHVAFRPRENGTRQPTVNRPEASERELLTVWPWTCSLQNCEKIHFL